MGISASVVLMGVALGVVLISIAILLSKACGGCQRSRARGADGDLDVTASILPLLTDRGQPGHHHGAGDHGHHGHHGHHHDAGAHHGHVDAGSHHSGGFDAGVGHH